LLSIHAGRLAFFQYVDLPALIPVFRSNLSAGFGLAVKIVVMGEFIGSQDGIGFLLNQARLILDMKGVFFYLVFLLIFTLIFQAIHAAVFNRFFQKYEFPE
jgi:NitT/TauT family transport system permease protein